MILRLMMTRLSRKSRRRNACKGVSDFCCAGMFCCLSVGCMPLSDTISNDDEVESISLAELISVRQPQETLYSFATHGQYSKQCHVRLMLAHR